MKFSDFYKGFSETRNDSEYVNINWEDFAKGFHYKVLKNPDEREKVVLALCYGEAANRFPYLNLFDRNARLRLTEIQKDQVVDFLKQMYKYYDKKVYVKKVDNKEKILVR